MSMTCTSCGEKAVKNGNYFITAKNIFGQTMLLGAVGVAVCPKCIGKHARGFLLRPMVFSILLFIFAVFCATMIVFIDGYGSTMQYIILAALTAMSLGGAVFQFVRLVKIIKRIRKPDNFIKTVSPAEMARIGAAILSRRKIITDNIFFSWPALSGVELPDEGEKLPPETLKQIREPFKLPMKRQLSLISFHKGDLHIPFTNIPDTMSKSTREIIKKAIKG